ncbi:MAG: polysaccharide deacetylase family protein [Thiobacillus sp.]
MSGTTRVPILMYHRVGEAHNDWESKYCVSRDLFDQHMSALANRGWHAISLARFLAWLEEGKPLPEHAFLLTFDDGFLGVYEHAAPILKKFGWPATVFLVSGLTGQRDVWCAAENPSGETYPLMDTGHIQALREQGFSFQSHTRHHADLPTLDDEALRDELAGSRSDLSSLLGEPVDYLAYPFGRFNDRVIAAAREAGYRAAFSTQPGFNRHDVDHFRLRRLDVFGTDSAGALLNKIRLGTNDGSLRNSVRYHIARALARLGF